MGDRDSVIPEIEREEDIVAAAKQLTMMALRSKRSLTDDTKKILADLSSQLIASTTVDENDVDIVGEIERHLTVIEEKIISWETDQSMIFDSGFDKATEYLNAVDGVRKLTERLEASCLNKDDRQKELLRRAQDALQRPMTILEEEFKHMLVQNRQPFDFKLDRMSVCSAHAGSVISVEDDLVGDSLNRDSVSRKSGEFIVDLVDPHVISQLRCMATLMFVSGRGHECSQAYVRIRSDALDECLSEMEKFSTDDVMKLESSSVNSKIKKWILTMKNFVEVYLASEKWLTKHIDSLYAFETGSQVRIECREVLRRLGNSVRATFLEFEIAIAESTASISLVTGGIDHLTKYVMSYIIALSDYRKTLNLLPMGYDGEDPISVSVDMSSDREEENISGGTCDFSPIVPQFRSDASILELALQWVPNEFGYGRK